jgi:hypothetical protein
MQLHINNINTNTNININTHTSTYHDMSIQGITSIKTDLGLGATTTLKVDPIGNFPVLTVKHKSLSCKALKADPSLYAKYCNVKTPMGFTFDQAIQAGLDAPHLGVGIAAGEPASYEVYKDIMDVVIEGWHGYKPTDSHKSDMDYTHLNMTPAQAAKFDKHVVSTRIRAGAFQHIFSVERGVNYIYSEKGG